MRGTYYLTHGKAVEEFADFLDALAAGRALASVGVKGLEIANRHAVVLARWKPNTFCAVDL